MLIAVRSLFSLVSRSREWLVFIAVAIAAAYLYVRFETVRVDRDRLYASAETTCAAAGESFVAAPAAAAPKGRIAVHRRGARCQARVAGLAAYERFAAAESARILAEANTAREGKTNRDVVLARSAADAARVAATKMEKANAQVHQDRTGADWFDALNDLAGLRSPGG